MKPLIAASNGNAELVTLLLDYGAHPSPEPYFGITPLSASIWTEDIQTVYLLLNAGAKPDQGHFPELWAAVENGWTDIVKLLIDHGADPQSTSWRDESLLEVAIEIGNNEIIELLIAAGAE